MKIKRRLLNMVNKDKTVSNRLSREKDTSKIYNKLLESNGPLKENKFHSKDIFALALAYGYSQGSRLPIESRQLFINKENFGKDLPALINALAITKSSDGIEILSEDTTEIYKFAEEYANGGLDILETEYMEGGDEFIEKLRLILLKLNEDDRIIKKLGELDI